MENYEVCHCMGVSYIDIERAMHENQSLSDVEETFKSIQEMTQCSTGCGGCHDKVLDIISEMLSK